MIRLWNPFRETYEVRGLTETLASYDSAAVGSGNIVDEVEYGYNDFGEKTASFQSHSGAVNTSTTPKVQYAYANGAANTIRPTSLTYPDGRVVSFNYGSGGSTNDAASRVGSVRQSATDLAAYQYLGLSTPVEVDYTEPDVRCRLYDAGAGGDIYTSLDSFGFGDTIVQIPANSQYYATSVSMTYNDQTFDVWFEADFDVNSGFLSVRFLTVDPDTSLPPDVQTGFLPPEDGTGRGIGFVNYSIRPKTDLATGTEIRNIAVIEFDNHETIATNQVDPHDPSQGTDPNKEALNTIDAGKPTSSIESLPSLLEELQFIINWSGMDDEGGSGIASYDIFVAVDGGPFELLLDNTTEMSHNFIGEHGKNYSFYSIARDNVGNEENTHVTPDAIIQVFENQAPDVSPIADQFTDEDNDAVIDFFISDDRSAADDLIITAFSSNHALVPDENIQISGSGDSCQLTISPLDDWFGVTTITLIVSDGEKSSFVQFDLTVYSVTDTIERQEKIVGVTGTDEGDEITIRLNAIGDDFEIAALQYVVTVNGVDYVFDPAEVDHIEVHGLDGNDILHVIGTSGNDDVIIHPGMINLVGPGITVHADGFPTIDVSSGGGEDRAQLFDSTGNDHYYATPTMATMEGDDYSIEVNGFRRVYAYSYAGGFDTAEIHDSPSNDNFTGHAIRSWMTGNGYYNSATRFDQVDAYATTGYNVAMFWDSSGNDTYCVEPGVGRLTGDGFNNIAHNFVRDFAYSYAGGVDEAHLYDSADADRFVGKENRSTIQNSDISYYASATRFEKVFGYAINGGADRAYLYGTPGNDTLMTNSGTMTMQGATYFYEISSFEMMNVFGGGGNDSATIYDSIGDDRFINTATGSAMRWANNQNAYIYDFRTVDLQALLGGIDTAEYRNLNTLDEIFGQDTLFQVARSNGKTSSATGMDLVIANSLSAPGPNTDLISLDYFFSQTGVWN